MEECLAETNPQTLGATPTPETEYVANPHVLCHMNRLN